MAQNLSWLCLILVFIGSSCLEINTIYQYSGGVGLVENVKSWPDCHNDCQNGGLEKCRYWSFRINGQCYLSPKIPTHGERARIPGDISGI